MTDTTTTDPRLRCMICLDEFETPGGYLSHECGYHGKTGAELVGDRVSKITAELDRLSNVLGDTEDEPGIWLEDEELAHYTKLGTLLVCVAAGVGILIGFAVDTLIGRLRS